MGRGALLGVLTVTRWLCSVQYDVGDSANVWRCYTDTIH